MNPRISLGIFLLGLWQCYNTVLGAQSIATNALIARVGDSAPGGGGGEVFLNFGESIGTLPVINARGDVAFVGAVSRGNGMAEVLFLNSNGSSELEQLADQDAPIPGRPELKFGQIFSLAINNLGEVMFLNVSENKSMLLGNTAGAWNVFGLDGTAAPGLPGTQFDGLPSGLSAFNNHFLFRSDGPLGVVFGARTKAIGLTEYGLWMVHPPALEPFQLLDYGGPAPDMTNGELLLDWSAMYSFALSSGPSGVVALDGRFTGPNVNSTNDEAVWLGPPSALKVVARSGQPTPPEIPGRFYRDFRELNINAAGQLCFVANVSANFTLDQALLAGTAGDLKLVARTDDALPGGGWLMNIQSVAINNAGEI